MPASATAHESFASGSAGINDVEMLAAAVLAPEATIVLALARLVFFLLHIRFLPRILAQFTRR